MHDSERHCGSFWGNFADLLPLQEEHFPSLTACYCGVGTPSLGAEGWLLELGSPAWQEQPLTVLWRVGRVGLEPGVPFFKLKKSEVQKEQQKLQPHV